MENLEKIDALVELSSEELKTTNGELLITLAFALVFWVGIENSSELIQLLLPLEAAISDAGNYCIDLWILIVSHLLNLTIISLIFFIKFLYLFWK